jgi:hypothetical protein
MSRLRKTPSCGSQLAIRHGKFGAFVGCLSYPRCKFSCQVGAAAEAANHTKPGKPSAASADDYKITPQRQVYRADDDDPNGPPWRLEASRKASGQRIDWNERLTWDDFGPASTVRRVPAT